jgi:MFS family permease
MAGAGCYLAAAALMLLFPYEITVTGARIVQGMGLALLGPGAFAAVPALAPRAVGSAMGVVTTVSSAQLAIGPAAGLALYNHGGAVLWLVPAMAVGLLGLAAAWLVKLPPIQAHDHPGRWFRFDRRWSAPLAANGLNGVYYGGILAYLPLYLAQIHGPNAGIFFTADAIGVVLLRIPAGMLADRTRPVVPMLAGVGLTLAGLVAFAPPTNVLWLVLAGVGTGVGAGLMASGALTELANLSTPANRGSAMALVVVSIGAGAFAGSTTAGLIINPWGFDGVILFGFVVQALALPLLLPTFLSGRRH